MAASGTVAGHCLSAILLWGTRETARDHVDSIVCRQAEYFARGLQICL